MLNQLVRKHPNVGAVYPMTIEQALGAELFTPGQFEIVTVLFDDRERLSNEVLTAVARIASRGTIACLGEALTQA
jgi:hypothetical protein